MAKFEFHNFLLFLSLSKLALFLLLVQIFSVYNNKSMQKSELQNIKFLEHFSIIQEVESERWEDFGEILLHATDKSL